MSPSSRNVALFVRLLTPIGPGSTVLQPNMGVIGKDWDLRHDHALNAFEFPFGVVLVRLLDVAAILGLPVLGRDAPLYVHEAREVELIF